MTNPDRHGQSTRRRGKPILHPTGRWKPGLFYSVSWDSAETDYGLLWGGLAVTKISSGSPKGRRPPTWLIIHCGSGHAVCIVEAHKTEAFSIADQIADLTDWTFEGLDGWKNTDPDLMDRMRVLAARHGNQMRFSSGSSHEAARAVAYARA